MLTGKGITIGEFEIKMLIEAAVAELNNSVIKIDEHKSKSSNDVAVSEQVG